ncbi:MAG TPA: biotin/lipoyl-binding protein, partial [Anaerolineales bacterium]|nr:biotin/lipoyl-binding protein [Anaerolineales bacterium]
MRYGKHSLGITILIIAVLALSGCDVFTQSESPALKASGVVEIMEVSISAEIGGRVSKVFVEEGAVVTSGDPLFSIDDEELQLQRTQVIVSGKAAVAGAELALLQA